MRAGYRHIPLYDALGQQYLFSCASTIAMTVLPDVVRSTLHSHETRKGMTTTFHDAHGPLARIFPCTFIRCAARQRPTRCYERAPRRAATCRP
jgi:hypothetical protein